MYAKVTRASPCWSAARLDAEVGSKPEERKAIGTAQDPFICFDVLSLRTAREGEETRENLPRKRERGIESSD